jgi:ankyrin repeat protein
VKAVREALKSLPKDLYDSYDNAMKRIEEQNEEDRHIAHSALIWVVNARRPLTVAELRVALAVEPGAQELDDDNLLDIEIILAVCAGLVIVDEQLSVVRLVHYTAQEYFESIQPQRFPDAQTEITRTLLTFLSFDCSMNSSWVYSQDLPPLVEYSQYCLMHAIGPPEIALRNMILEFHGLDLCWKNTIGWGWVSPPWNSVDFPSQPSALWIAAAANLLETAKFLLKEAPTPQHSDSPEISVASYYGHLQMVELLVEHSANVNAQGGHFGHALQAASFNGHIDVVQLLMEHGVNVDAQGGEYQSALQAASCNGHIDIVQLLMEHGANVNVQGGQYGSALQAASVNGHMDIVQLLIEHDADVNMQGREFGNALQAALYNGHMDIVQLLIQHGSHVNVQGGEHRSALQAASINGHIESIQFLIDQGAEVNVLGGEYGSTLQAASYYGHIDIVQLLIKHGADVSAQGGKYGSALKAALYREPDDNQPLIQRLETVAQLLRDNGALEEDLDAVRNKAVSEHEGQQSMEGEYSF